jgi:hypothetical protein
MDINPRDVLVNLHTLDVPFEKVRGAAGGWAGVRQL